MTLPNCVYNLITQPTILLFSVGADDVGRQVGCNGYVQRVSSYEDVEELEHCTRCPDCVQEDELAKVSAEFPHPNGEWIDSPCQFLNGMAQLLIYA